MAEDTRRYISRTGTAEGPYTVDELYAMAAAGQINFQTFFWSEAKKAWKPLAGLMLDVDPDRLDQMIKEGVKRVRVFGSGGKDCHACSVLGDKVFPIESPPVLPPATCRCVPWCRLVLAPVQEGTASSASSG